MWGRASLFFLVISIQFANVTLADDVEFNFYGSAQGYPKFHFGGLVDLRLVRTDDTKSWLDGGLGKTRYGSIGGDEVTAIRPAQINALTKIELADDLSFKARIDLDVEYAEEGRGEHVHLQEGFLDYMPVIGDGLALRSRTGVFFPPVSLENRNRFWRNEYTISNSAINSWIGDEVRTIGTELGLFYQIGDHELEVRGSAYGYNDTTGALLAWRGFALGDRQSGISDEIPLAPIPSIQPTAPFRDQFSHLEPYEETDERVGFYGSAGWKYDNRFELHYIHYDNRADEARLNLGSGQYGWDTSFNHVGARLEFLEDYELVSQYLKGNTMMGISPRGRVVLDNNFYSYFFLLSRKFKSDRASIRFDRFEVDDIDPFKEIDDNREKGYAFTLAYIHSIKANQRLAVELLNVYSDRPVRSQIGLDPTVNEFLFQLSYGLTL